VRLLDSNIIIYATSPQFEFLRKMIANENPFVSVISKIEVLGYHKLNEKEKHILLTFFNSASIIGLSENIATKSISLRQKYNLTLGDAIIAATALENRLELITRNSADFKNIIGLKVYNPFHQ
jgi:predicted nucleic acid-binding protein